MSSVPIEQHIFREGLYAKESTINFPGDNIFTANWAGTKCGGIYTQASNVSFSGTGLLSTNVAQLINGTDSLTWA